MKDSYIYRYIISNGIQLLILFGKYQYLLFCFYRFCRICLCCLLYLSEDRKKNNRTGDEEYGYKRPYRQAGVICIGLQPSLHQDKSQWQGKQVTDDYQYQIFPEEELQDMQ